MIFSPRAKEQLAQQHLKYLDTLAGKRNRILNSWEVIQNEGWTKDRLNSLKTEVHRLSGSAGSYGLLALGDAAQSLDRMLALESEMTSLTSAISDLISNLLLAFNESMETTSLN